MKISINAVVARCTLFYFQYFSQLTLEFGCFLYFHWYLKKDVICVKFGTRTQATI